MIRRLVHRAAWCAACVAWLAAMNGCVATSTPPTAPFARISPEAAGYSAERLAALGTLLQRAGSDSLLLLHEGKLLYEWGDTRKKLLLHSMRKPLLNALLGVCHGEGRIDLDATLDQMGIDDDTPLTEAEKRATLRQVLQSRSGVYLPAAAESEGMAASRPARGSHAPGSHFYYNNWDFNVAGHVYEKFCGARIYDAFDRRIARRIGMMDYRNRIGALHGGPMPIDPNWDGFTDHAPGLSRYPAYHFRLTAQDLARFGQLYLQHGIWNGEPIVPANWIDLSTQPVSTVDARYGLAYGMLWDVLVPSADEKRPAFFHTGAGVHMLGVYPSHRLVMVHRVDTEAGAPFDEGNLYRIIRAIHAARLKPAAATATNSSGGPVAP